MNLPLLFAVSLMFFSNPSFAGCIDQFDPSIPACPKNKTQALDDTYPAAYVTVGPGQGDDQMGLDFAIKAFKADAPTKIVVTGWSQRMVLDLKSRLKQNSFTDDQINEKIIVFSAGTDYQWQQDFVQPEFDPATGAPVMRPIQGYLKDRVGFPDQKGYFDQLGSAINQNKIFCENGPTTGKPLPEKVESNHLDSAYYGGNMEGFPGGLCLVGDSLPKESFSDFCKNNPDLAITVPTSWLNVGHVDEVVSVVRDNSAKAPCNYAVLRASPKKAIDLLNPALNPATQNEVFFKLDQKDRSTSTQICNSWENYSETVQSIPTPHPDQTKTLKGSSIFWRQLLNFTAQAGTPGVIIDSFNCSTLTNSQAYLGITHDPNLADFNQLVEEKMQKAEEEIRKKAAAQGCANIKIIPVPNLFRGNSFSKDWQNSRSIEVTLEDGTVLNKRSNRFTEREMRKISQKQRLEKFGLNIDNRSGHAINPNPSNSVLLGNTLLFPKQKNAVFEEYLKKQVAGSLKLETDFVNTWQSAHTNDGNLHCSTNTFRYCRP